MDADLHSDLAGTSNRNGGLNRYGLRLMTRYGLRLMTRCGLRLITRCGLRLITRCGLRLITVMTSTNVSLWVVTL